MSDHELAAALRDVNRENIRLRDSHEHAQRRIETLEAALMLACAALSGTHEEAKALARSYKTVAAK